VHHGRVVKRTGDGAIVEFRSAVDAVRCAIEVQNAMVERNAEAPADRRIVFRIGIHIGDVVEESDGDLMGDGVNIAARLQGIAQPGAICLSEDAYRQVKSRLDLKVSDLGAMPLKNITEPVHVYSLQVGVPTQAKPAPETKLPERQLTPSPPNKRLALALLAAGIAALVIMIAGGAWWLLGANRPAPVLNAPPPIAAQRLSVVVLPFANLGGDPAQDYLADALTDQLTTAIARIHDSFVIARNTAFTFKGKPVDAKAIRKELGVRYVLEGSVLPSANQVRVNAQLIDADSGAHLWADQFDTPRADLLQMQDEIVTDVRAMGLADEEVPINKNHDALWRRLRINGASMAEIKFLLDGEVDEEGRIKTGRRVELNAMTSDVFVAFVERKLTEAGARKVMPSAALLRDAYVAFVREKAARAEVEVLLKRLADQPVDVPADLEARIGAFIDQHSDKPWDAEARRIAGALENDEDED
jgi:TolB-like protein